MSNAIRGIHLGQVTDVDPTRYRARMVFPNLAHSEGIMVALGGARQHPVAGDFQMPEIGDWGIIAFWTDDARAGVWLASVSDRYRHIIPTELFTSDPVARLHHTPGDHYTIEHGDGTLESVWPDSSMIRVTTGKDGSAGNPTGSVARTERKRTLSPAKGRDAERLPLSPAARGPVDIVLDHSSGARVRITADGSFKMTTPKGHAFTLHDATEKARDPADPTSVTGTPEEDASRIASDVILESEMGARVHFHDDPINEADRYVRVRTGAGHQIEMRDKPDANQYVLVETVGKVSVELREMPDKIITMKTPGLRSIVMDDTAGKTTITDPVEVTVVAPLVNVTAATVNVGTDVVKLGEGGAAVARVGDTVEVTTSTTVSGTAYAGTGSGTITSGNPKVSG